MTERASETIKNTKAEISKAIENAALKVRDAVVALTNEVVSDPSIRERLPVVIAAYRRGGEPSNGGGYFEDYPAFDVMSGQLVMVTEEYFAFGLGASTIHKKNPLPIEDWLKYAPKIIEQVERCVERSA